jgi:hypothetical protein
MMQQQQHHHHHHYGANNYSGVSEGGRGGDALFDPVAALMQPTAGAVARLRHNNNTIINALTANVRKKQPLKVLLRMVHR